MFTETQTALASFIWSGYAVSHAYSAGRCYAEGHGPQQVKAQTWRVSVLKEICEVFWVEEHSFMLNVLANRCIAGLS
jgi:hypothetical protein